MRYINLRLTYLLTVLRLDTRSSAVAETARVTIRSVIAVDRLTLTVTLHVSLPL